MAFGYPDGGYGAPDPWLAAVGPILQGVGGGFGSALQAYGQQQAIKRQAAAQDAARAFQLQLEQMKEGSAMGRTRIQAGATLGAAQIGAEARLEGVRQEEAGRNKRAGDKATAAEVAKRLDIAKQLHDMYQKKIDPTAERAFTPQEMEMIQRGLDPQNPDPYSVMQGWQALMDESGKRAQKNLDERNKIRRQQVHHQQTLEEQLLLIAGRAEVNKTIRDRDRADKAGPFDFKSDPNVNAWLKQHGPEYTDMVRKKAAGLDITADIQRFSQMADEQARTVYPDDPAAAAQLHNDLLDAVKVPR